MYRARNNELNTTMEYAHQNTRQLESKSKSFNMLMRDSFIDDFL